jgi:starch synthase
MKVVFCASEVFPFAKTGGLADVCGALPAALKEQGVEVSVFLPAYRGVVDRFQAEAIQDGLYKTALAGGVPVYLVDHPGYFDREYLYGDDRGDYADNFDRFLYFNRKVIEYCEESGLRPDIIHCHDWQTAMIPVLLRHKYHGHDFWKGVKTLLTVHNMAFQGDFPDELFPKLGLAGTFPPGDAMAHGRINFLKAGLMAADEVNTVSPRYAQEIYTPEFGCGLQDVLKGRARPVKGIINGIDRSCWDARTDPLIEVNFDAGGVEEAKRINKRALQAMLDLPDDPDVPLFVFVGRLSHQKGVGVLLEALPQILSMHLQVVVQGRGDRGCENALREMASARRDHLAFAPRYDEPLAHQVYAGGDFFLMPSVFEPCGLTQMISMAYAALPVAHLVGGLLDTIKTHEQYGRDANGFGFRGLDAGNLARAVESAVGVYRIPSELARLRRNALAADFSWGHSAQDYRRLYQCLLSE